MTSNKLIEEMAAAIKSDPIHVRGQPNEVVFYGMNTHEERLAYAEAARTFMLDNLQGDECRLAIGNALFNEGIVLTTTEKFDYGRAVSKAIAEHFGGE